MGRVLKQIGLCTLEKTEPRNGTREGVADVDRDLKTPSDLH